MGTIRFKGNAQNEFKDATHWDFKDTLRISESIETLANDVYQKTITSQTVALNSTADLTTLFNMNSGFYEITMTGERFIYAYVADGGTVTSIAKSSNFGTSAGAESVNLYVVADKITLQENSGVERDYTVRFNGDRS